MVEKFDIAGYCRISDDDNLDRDNTSIENQKAIIDDYVKNKFPTSSLTFYEDRDRSGYTFEQRESYQMMRPKLMGNQYDILIVKDFSRFSRRNSRGLCELEDLRDAGVRIISIGDNVDYPTHDDWRTIQLLFFVNEMPVTDTSKKVRYVINRRQNDGKWICAVPYGYVITNTKAMTFEVEPTEAVVVKHIFQLYIEGWGYKKIANFLTEKHIPTPRMKARMRKEAKGEEYKAKVSPEWSIATVQGILTNDFYIGTLRQGKYARKKINGKDIKKDVEDHIVFENNHEPIIDYKTFALASEQMKKRSKSNYRGIKKFDNVYSGLLVCGDCNSPMFSMSRSDLKDAYHCGRYHRLGAKGCTSHHTRVDLLDDIIKSYLASVRASSSDMIRKLEESIKNEKQNIKPDEDTITMLDKQIEDSKEELKILTRQKTRELMRNPDDEEIIEETYSELIKECQERIEGLRNQLTIISNKRNDVIKINRIAKTSIDIFDNILNKDKFDKQDLELIIDKIVVYEDRIHIKLKDDIECILKSGTLENKAVANFKSGIIDILQKTVIHSVKGHKDKVYGVNVISDGDPLEIFTATDGEVVFKKYSPVGELGNFASQYADVLTRISQMPTVITDRDHVIAVAGASKREFLERRVTQTLEHYMEQRRSYTATETSNGDTFPVEGVDTPAGIIYPIIASGDVTGSVCMLQSDTVKIPTDAEIKLCQSASAFLGKQMEE